MKEAVGPCQDLLSPLYYVTLGFGFGASNHA